MRISFVNNAFGDRKHIKKALFTINYQRIGMMHHERDMLVLRPEREAQARKRGMVNSFVCKSLMFQRNFANIYS